MKFRDLPYRYQFAVGVDAFSGKWTVMLRFGNIYKLWTCSVLQYKYRCSLSRCKPAAVSILLPAVISMLLFLKIHVANGKQQHQQVCRQATCMLKMSSYTNKLAGLTFSILMPRLCQFSARTRLHACKTCALMTLFYRNTVLFSPAKNWCKWFEFSNYSKNLICKIFDEEGNTLNEDTLQFVFG